MKNVEKKELKATYESNGQQVTLTDNMIRKFLVKSPATNVTVSDQEIMMFLSLCKYQKLNPFLNEAYLVKMSSNYAATIIVSKDVFLKRAARNPSFDGKKAGVVVIHDGEIVRRNGSLITENENLIGGWCEVYRKDQAQPVCIEVSMNEYAKKKRDGSYNQNWATMPATMIRKVAVAQALREAFPEDCAGMYIDEEMDQAQKISTPEEEDVVAKLINESKAEEKIVPQENIEIINDTPKECSEAEEFFKE